MELISENILNSSNKQGSRIYSEEEKRGYCELWKNSGLSKVSFCKSNGLNNKTFSNWCKAYIKEDSNEVEFARVVSGANGGLQSSKLELNNVVQMEILNTAGSQIRINLSRLDALYIIKGLYDGN
jgi:transposase-like protein